MICWFRQGQGAALQTMKENFATVTLKKNLKFTDTLETLKTQWRHSFLHFENSNYSNFQIFPNVWVAKLEMQDVVRHWMGWWRRSGRRRRRRRWRSRMGTLAMGCRSCSGDRTGNIGSIRFYIMNQCAGDQQSKLSINEVIDSDMIDTGCKVQCFCCCSDGCYKE